MGHYLLLGLDFRHNRMVFIEIAISLLLPLTAQHNLFVIALVKVPWLDIPLLLTPLDLKRLRIFHLDLV